MIGSRPLPLLAVLCLVAGCATFPPEHAPRIPANQLRDYYDYPRASIQAKVAIVSTTKTRTRERVEFDLQLPEGLGGPEKVRIDYYRPRTPGPHPLVLMTPMFGGADVLMQGFGRYFADRGFCAALVERKPPPIGPKEGLDAIERDLRKSVLRIRQAVDWVSGRPEIDAGRIASLGLSYGAIVNAIAAGAEPRIKYHVFVLAGGDVPAIILSSTEAQIRRPVMKIGQARGLTQPQLRGELASVVKSDPLNSAPVLARENILMVVARFDTVIGTPYQNLLWEQLGKPQRILVPLGHYSTALALPYLRGKVLQFLQKKF